MNNERCEVFDIIITLTKAFNTLDANGNPHVISKYNKEEKYLWNCKYLLNQVLRNYNVPPERYHVSKAAKELWDSITDDDIKNYYYHEKVVNTKSDSVCVVEYKGSSKSGHERAIKKGEGFVYRDVFHNEHAIPIDTIMNEIIDLAKNNALDYASLDKALNKIHICRILKMEDREIKNKYKRPNSYDEVLKTVYAEAGITIID